MTLLDKATEVRLAKVHQSVNVCPVFSVGYEANHATPDAEQSPDLTVSKSRSQQFPYLHNLCPSEFLLAQIILTSVPCVFLARNVFKVLGAVIGFNRISVVDLVVAGDRPNKGAGYQAVNKNEFTDLIEGKFDAQIALFSGNRVQRSSDVRSRASNSPSDPSQVRHLIGTFVVWYVAPFFGFKFFGGKFLDSQGANLLRLGLALVRPVRVFQHSGGSFCILPQQEAC